MNRNILLQRMFACGVNIGLCRLILSILDLTQSLVRIGNLLSKPFTETLGVREGVLDSPFLFSMYISGLRQRLEDEHPRLCTFAGIDCCVLLYADDAALPADSASDLQLSASILEQFCNDMHLCISLSKTVLAICTRLVTAGLNT